MKKSNLEVKVLSINTLYKYAAKCIEHEKKHFDQFLGKDIFKVGGEVKQKYSHERLTFEGFLPDGTHYHVHCWYQLSYKHFYLNVKSCVNGGSYEDKPVTAFCQYDSTMTTLYKVKDGKLTVNDNSDTDYLNKRYEVSELMEIKKGIEKAAELYKAEVNKMPYIFNDVLSVERLTR